MIEMLILVLVTCVIIGAIVYFADQLPAPFNPWVKVIVVVIGIVILLMFLMRMVPHDIAVP